MSNRIQLCVFPYMYMFLIHIYSIGKIFSETFGQVKFKSDDQISEKFPSNKRGISIENFCYFVSYVFSRIYSYLNFVHSLLKPNSHSIKNPHINWNKVDQCRTHHHTCDNLTTSSFAILGPLNNPWQIKELNFSSFIPNHTRNSGKGGEFISSNFWVDACQSGQKSWLSNRWKPYRGKNPSQFQQTRNSFLLSFHQFTSKSEKTSHLR